MARDITTTPVVTGKDAVRFYEKMEANRNKIADTATLERIEQSVRYVQSLGLRRI